MIHQLYTYPISAALGNTFDADITTTKIANQVTVRIFTKFGSGSGVVINHEG
ncbi:MAG: hypothetical protein WCO29_01345 [Nostocales cyanobacterium ELA583]